MPIQQMLLGVGAKKKTYMDDVFSTFLYKGNADDSGSSSQSINNGINLSGEGGMTWIKWRGGTYSHSLFDTVRGNTKRLSSEGSGAENTWTDAITSFNNNGFTLGSSAQVNYENLDFASWTFRKAPGFFDVVTYTGNGTAGRTVSHSLGCEPGMIIVKNLDSTENWTVYHRGVGSGSPQNWEMQLDTNNAASEATGPWNNTAPTSSVFTVGSVARVNENGSDFVAYLFAGGESAAATARSVEFDGSDWLTTASSTDYGFGTGDFTIECWVKLDSYPTGGVGSGQDLDAIISFTDDRTNIDINSSGSLSYYDGTSTSVGNVLPLEQWTHIAYSKEGTSLRVFVNGVLLKTITTSYDAGTSARQALIGSRFNGNHNTFNGNISNFRIVKGTAVYTSSFRPPTEPLTSISGTSLLCCNNSSVTGATTGTVTSSGSPTASTDSPFDDPAGFVFGDAGDQNVIKCGSYVGNGNADGPEINLGWEPSFIITKSSTYADPWRMFDVMRGIVTGGNEAVLTPSLNEAEYSSDKIEVTTTGFKVSSGAGDVNENNQDFIFLAIRRSDGYVGKPPSLGTDVFTMDTGNSSTTIPNFDSGFPLDFALVREPASSGYLYSTARLMARNYIFVNGNADQSTASTSWTWDSNTGWNKAGYNTDWVSWMWKRHKGFDVVTYKGNGSGGRLINHSLNKAPEMMWIKNRTTSGYDWAVYHKGLNGGSSPEDYWIKLNSSSAEADENGLWNDTAPTSVAFKIGTASAVNRLDDDFIAMLFASVDGISKVGYFNDSGSQTITTGFQPRFIILKPAAQSNDWFVFDTTRGWSSGNDQVLKLNSDAAQSATWDVGAPTSTGFTVVGAYNWGNTIYYAHA